VASCSVINNDRSLITSVASSQRSLAIRVEGCEVEPMYRRFEGLVLWDSSTEKSVAVRAIATDGSLVSWLIAVHPE